MLSSVSETFERVAFTVPLLVSPVPHPKYGPIAHYFTYSFSFPSSNKYTLQIILLLLLAHGSLMPLALSIQGNS